MSIGIGSVLGLWLVSGVAFWSGFVLLGFGFRPSDEREDAWTACGTVPASSGSASAPLVAAHTSRPADGRARPDRLLVRAGR